MPQRAYGSAPAGSPATGDVIYSDEELEFLKAVDAWKRKHRKPYPTLCDLLQVLRTLGWSRGTPPSIPPEAVVGYSRARFRKRPRQR